MTENNKYTEIMKLLNYKPIGSVLLRLCGVIKRFEGLIMFFAYVTAFWLFWELWISILACLGAIFGDDPNWYFQFSIIYWIKNVL
jgi:hypothetical protein